MGSARPIRYFACGEYGEQTARPHYHAILYGISEKERNMVEDAWGLGHTRTEKLTPARIAYAAGYTAKKIGWLREASEERVDPDTGEVYKWQPPFILMSRRPGIGGEARQHTSSWRSYAIQDGYRLPVPRFLHEAWKKQATQQEIEEVAHEKYKIALNRDTSARALQAAEQHALKQQELQGHKRKL